MKWILPLFGLVAAAFASDEGAVTGIIKPDGDAPAGCKPSYDGKFQITTKNLQQKQKRSLKKRSCDAEGTLVMTLQDGVLKDSRDRTGYIASNFQFQFDAPPQAGTIYTAGFSVCSNNTLALGPSTVFYQCLSGDFYNLYDRHWAEQCEPIEIVTMSCDATLNAAVVNEAKEGEVEMKPTTMVAELADGQPQAISTSVPIPVNQIDDGQIQAKTTPAVSQIDDGQIQAPKEKPRPAVSQIDDGQIQNPKETGAPANQIDDGQVQQPKETGAPANQIDDGQVQQPKETGAPANQIDDGQVQQPKESGKPAEQIDDGQVQQPKESSKPVSQLPDGQPQTSNDTAPQNPPSPNMIEAGASRSFTSAVTALIVVAVGATAFMF